MAEETGLTKAEAAGPLALADIRPEHLKQNDFRGSEHIKKDDIQLPRIGLTQAMSPQVQELDLKYIKDLKVGDMFNNLTGQNLGRGPLEFCVVRGDAPRGIIFNPLDQGGGIKEMNVPLTDPRMQFGPNGAKPEGTKFYDFVVALLPSFELIALSFKSSGLRTARELNSLIKLRNAPVFAGKYVLTSAMTKNAKGTFAVFQVKNSDIASVVSAKAKDGTPLAGWLGHEAYQHAESLYNGLKDKTLIIQREPGEDDVEFAEEGQVVTGEM